jgi:hypothetical protein
MLFRDSVPRWEKNVQLDFHFAHAISVLFRFYFLNYDSWTLDVIEFKEGAISLPLLASAHISVSNEIALIVSVLSQMEQSTLHPVSFMFFLYSLPSVA